MTIGQLAKRANVNVETIRYYERRRLVPEPRRTPSGYRQYGEPTVARIRFIKRAQELGFSLKDIAELLALRVRHAAACGPVERKTRAKIELVEQKIRELQGMKTALERVIAACEAKEPTSECPLLEELEEEVPLAL